MIRKSVAIFLVLGALVSVIAVAQVDPGVMPIFQDGWQVGVVWTPDRDLGACEYREHWYLFEGYRYPGREQPIETKMTVDPDSSFESLEAFEAVMAEEHPGGHHVTVVAIEHRSDCP